MRSINTGSHGAFCVMTPQWILDVAKGPYQRAVLLGEQRISGSDLRGKAARFGGSYRRSRENVLRRATTRGIPLYVSRNKYGHLKLCFGVRESDKSYLGIPLIKEEN